MAGKMNNPARIYEPKIEYDGYNFHRNGSYGDTIYYVCSFRKFTKSECKVHLKIKNGIYTTNGNHNHDKPIFDLREIKKKIKISKAFETTRIIKKRIISKYDHLLDKTKISNIEKSIFRYKRQNLGQTPKNLNELKESLEGRKKEEWKKLLLLDSTNSAHSFTVDYVTENNQTKAIIFIDKILTDLIINAIDGKLTIFLDGTFESVPKLKNNNCQLWTIVIRHDNRTFPIVYTIMEGRCCKNYIEVLKKVTNIIKITPDVAIVDFEKAELKAIRTVFPRAKIIGCFFHYSQALQNNADKHGLLKGEVKELGCGATKLLTALALLPEKLILEGFEVITNVIFRDCENLKLFFNYYKKTWINGFKPNLFCVYKEINRTNNASERHNRELKQNLGKHSTIVQFLGNLTEHQKDVRSLLKHPEFWLRSKHNNLKQKEEKLRTIWQDVERNKNEDLLLILYKLTKLVGKDEN